MKWPLKSQDLQYFKLPIMVVRGKKCRESENRKGKQELGLKNESLSYCSYVVSDIFGDEWRTF